MKVSTRSADSLSTARESLATCSISSLKLTAPSLYLHAEDLADDTAKQAFQARIAQIRQRSNSRFLPGFQLLATALLYAEPCNKGANLLRLSLCQFAAAPYRLQ